ncbi:MAG: ParB/RepB/Spo0J family partition protein, partial [Brevibacterium yomogidense]
MAEKRRGLGRGLGSLIPSQETGRPSDVFFPRSERADPDAKTDSQETEREKVPSDPAESMRRAQAGRKTGSAKRTPAKGATQKPAASK